MYVKAKKKKKKKKKTDSSLTMRNIHKKCCNWFDDNEIDSEFLLLFFRLQGEKDFSSKYLYFCVWLLFKIDNINDNIIWDQTMPTPIQSTNSYIIFLYFPDYPIVLVVLSITITAANPRLEEEK